MLEYQDWDCIVSGTLVPLIYQEEMVWDHCGPTTIAGANAQRATELMKEQGLLHYKERRVHIASLEACVTSLEVLARRAPAVKSKVTMLPRARSFHSGEGLPVTALDQLSGPEEEVLSPGAGRCKVLQSPSKRYQADPMWEPTRWLKGHVKCLTHRDVPWWELVMPMMNGGTQGTKELAQQLLTTWQWTFVVGAADFCLLSPSVLRMRPWMSKTTQPGCWPTHKPYNA